MLLCGCSHRALLTSLTSPGSPELKMIVRLDESAAVLDEILSSPDKGIPHEILARSQCVVIMPGLESYSLVVGAEWGSGFISCRAKGGAGWTAPGALSLEGGSFGFQIGGGATDLLLLVMNQGAEDKLLRADFTIGVDAFAAAGPVGRSVGADTGSALKAEILSWSHSSGLFAGVSLEGAVLRQDAATLQLLYARAITNRQVVMGRTKVPQDARRLIGVLEHYSPRFGRE